MVVCSGRSGNTKCTETFIYRLSSIEYSRVHHNIQKYLNIYPQTSIRATKDLKSVSKSEFHVEHAQIGLQF